MRKQQRHVKAGIVVKTRVKSGECISISDSCLQCCYGDDCLEVCLPQGYYSNLE